MVKLHILILSMPANRLDEDQQHINGYENGVYRVNKSDEDCGIPKKISRREFLKKAGIVIGGAALASIPVFSACNDIKTSTAAAGSRATASGPLTSNATALLTTAHKAVTSKPAAVTTTITTTSPIAADSTPTTAPSPTTTSIISTGNPFNGNVILGRPADVTIGMSLLSSVKTDVYIEYGNTTGVYNDQTSKYTSQPNQPLQIDIDNLQAHTRYFYRVCHHVTGEIGFSAGTESTFHTQRTPGSTFNFGVQGDSHPERTTTMFNPDLYNLTMANVKNANPDFYFLMGDDFSVDPMISKNQLSQPAVNDLYSNQRNHLNSIGNSSPIFLVNGNHDQAARYLLDGTANNAAVFVGQARTQYFPLPAPGTFYSGDTEPVPFIGLLRDYYAWTWGDALFVLIDFYWHSPVAVDNVAGNETTKTKDMWEVTLGDTQYNWFKQTLEGSKAKYKFVFSHHVLGTGRGGIEEAGQYEWGGNGSKGNWQFDSMRPGWAMPIHQLMAKNGVSIFFHCHDHLFAHQVLDGVVYQEVPIPADFTYTAFNSDAYKSGSVLPNAGFLNVTVSTAQVKVDYISSYLPKDEKTGRQNGQIAISYSL